MLLVDFDRSYHHQSRLLSYCFCQIIILYNIWIWIESSNIEVNAVTMVMHNLSLGSSNYFPLKSTYNELNRSRRYISISQNLIQLSYNCVVYDETSMNSVLIDEINGNTCQLLSTQMLSNLEKVSISIKIITTGNPLAKYFTIDLNNYTLITVQRVDREELCAYTTQMTESSISSTVSIPNSLRICCINHRKECIFPLNILVQTRLDHEDTTTTTNKIFSSSDSMNVNDEYNHDISSNTRTSNIIKTVDKDSSSSIVTNLRSKFFIINIKLIDINDNPPKFPNLQYTIHVSEGINIGTRLPLPLAEDLDSIEYNIVQYQLLTQGDETFELIQISSEFPELSLTSSTSNQVQYASSNLDYYVRDLNHNDNNLPYGKEKNAFVYHPSLSSSSSSSSPATNQPLLLPHHHHHQSRPEQLYLKIAKQLDWETKRSYHFVLNAVDNGSPAFTGQMYLEIIVTDENDNHPVFRNKSLVVYVPENSPEGLRLIQLIADDPDDGLSGQIVYSIVSIDGEHLSNNMKGLPLANNDNPHHQIQHNAYNTSIVGKSNKPIDTPTITTTTTTTKNNKNSSSSSARRGLFEIDPKTGWLSTRARLDYEQSKHHLIRVLAHDQSGHPGFDEAIVSIFVTDVNDVPPQITVESVNGITSKKSSDDSEERNNVLQVYINETPGQSGINRQLSKNFDAYNTEDISLSTITQLLAFVVVSDPDTGPGGSFQCYLEPMTTSNVNHKVHHQTSQTSSLKEMQRLERLFYPTIHHTTAEEHNLQSATISNSQTSMIGPFQLNPISSVNFELITIGGFDYEFSQSEWAKIVCIDNGEPSLTSSHVIKVFVQDVNDNPPVFSRDYYNFVVQENSPVNTFVNKVIATDVDSEKNSEIEYRLSIDINEYFSINQLDGSIYTNVIFDRELRQNYRFQVYASDHGQPKSLTSTSTIEVNILDLNDNTPMFVGLDRDNCYHFRVAENQPSNTYVGILLGTDNDIDENAQLLFRLVGSSSKFKVNISTGELTTLQMLDREKQSNYELVVLLSDKGKPPRSTTSKVYIHVTDTNDHDPIVVFPANGKGNVSVSYREPPGEVVARIEARDPDEGHNALLHFTLYSGNQASVFRLGSTSAELIIDRELTEQDITVYPLVIHIQDSGIPSRTTEVKLWVKITDSPPRVYSHQFSDLHSADDSKSLTLHRRFKDGQHSTDDQGKMMRINEFPNSQEDNFISAGSILVAIVALSCAIILVLLGITVYVCGRRGFHTFRCYNNTNNCNSNDRTQYLTRNHNSINSIQKLSNEKINWKTIFNSNLNTTHNNNNSSNNIHTSNITLYPNKSILIDKDNGNLLQYHIDSNDPTILNNEEDYTDRHTESVHLTPLIIEQNQHCYHHHHHQEQPQSYHEGYTTFIPLSERSTNYTTLPTEETKHSIYIPLPLSFMSSDRLKENYEKHWTLKDYSSSPQTNQKLISFITSKGYHSQEKQKDEEDGGRKHELIDQSKVIPFQLTTVNVTTSTDNKDIVNNSYQDKITHGCFTQSLKLKKLDKSQSSGDSLEIIRPDCSLNNQHSDYPNSENQIRTARSWEYIFIPHISQPNVCQFFK
ncbi:unnamed protein product [Heterobilharzia americana]|nr:unnamed protein product [Heterobilharzia americana]